MNAYDYLKPDSLDAVFDLLRIHGPEARLIAGGTDVLVQMRAGQIAPRVLISLRGLRDLAYIQKNGDYRIGALTTHAMLERSQLARRELAALSQGCGQVGAVQLRNVATLGGNLCNAAPSADSAAPLLALGAEVILQGPAGRRGVALHEFFSGPSQTTMETDEVLVEVRIPGRMEGYGSAYWKHARRRALNLPIVGIAAAVQLEAEIITDVRIGMTVVAPTPVRAWLAEDSLRGKPLTDEVLAEAGQVASSPECCLPRDSLRCEGWYREEMVRVLVPRVVRAAAAQIRERAD